MDEKLLTNCYIDTSYVVYYTMFSTFSWYKKEFGAQIFERDTAKPDKFIIPEGFDPMLDGAYKDDFKAEFLARFDNNIALNIQENVPIIANERIFFCLDCSRKDIWRRAIYPEYKMNREKKRSEIVSGGTFNYVTNHVLPMYVEDGMKVIPKVFGAEGDDIIAVAVKHEFDNGHTNNLVMTSDTDLYQLADMCFLVKCDGGRVDNEMVMKKYNPGLVVTPKEYIVLKSFSGDTADNISSIFNRCGPKTAQKLWLDPSMLAKKIEKDPTIQETIDMNRRIMDMDYLPKELVDIILEEYINTKLQ